MNPILAQLNAADPEQATHQILPCCGSQAWAKQLTASRPFRSLEAITDAANQIWNHLPEADWLEAFATHPRIGERQAAATAESLKWSSAEQLKAASNEGAKAALTEANRLYEARFHRTFIVCATGKSAEEILAILNHRLTNTPEAELREAAEQQRQITNLRLAKWLQGA